MNIDRAAFADRYRKDIGPLGHHAESGLSGLLQNMSNDTLLHDIREAAYMLATVKHECANTWQPIDERGNVAYFDKYEPETLLGQRLGNDLPGDGFLFRGRGYVQITGRSNYEKLTRRLGVNLVLHPDYAMVPYIAYDIMAAGMREGLFTGKALADFSCPQDFDYLGARQIVNGHDQARLIADSAITFELILAACDCA